MGMVMRERIRFGITGPRVALFLCLSMSASLFEGFGMAMMLPVLEYIQEGQDLTALAAKSGLWEKLIAAYGVVGLEVTFVTLLSGLFLLILMRTVMTYLRTVYVSWFCQDIMHRTRTALFNAYARAEYGIFDKLATGRLLNAATIETQRFGGYASGIMNLTAVTVVLMGFMAVLFWLSWSMTLFAMALLGLGGLVVLYFIRKTKKISIQTTDSNARFSFMLVELLQAMRLIKLSASGEREIENVDQASRDVRRFNFSISELNARVDLLLEPVVVVAGLGLLFAAVNVFAMSLPQIGLFMLVLLRLMPLAKELLRTRQSVQAVSGSVAEVGRMYREAEDIPEKGEGGRGFEGLEKGVQFEEVSFYYPGKDKPALSEVDLLIPAGEITALVGPSGAGKSTLVDLLPGLRKPSSGRILFDGTDQKDFDLDSLRRGMAFVSQDAVIFNDTVRANLVYSCPDAGEDEIKKALSDARAGEFIASLPRGLDTVLGERGVSLSGGQRQRMSLARALIKKAPLLIMDEPTSALDSETERDIQAAIDAMRRAGKVTILIIAHRLSTIRNADKIVVLENGRVSEQGSHKELMVSDEWYARISGMQSADSN